MSRRFCGYPWKGFEAVFFSSAVCVSWFVDCSGFVYATRRASPLRGLHQRSVLMRDERGTISVFQRTVLVVLSAQTSVRSIHKNSGAEKGFDFGAMLKLLRCSCRGAVLLKGQLLSCALE